MTIDETIEHSRNIAKEQRYYANFEKGMMRGVCINTAENNEQLAEWLEELKEARKGFEENRKAGYKHGYSDGYAKGIDEFAELLRTKIKEEIDDCADELEWIDKISERLKAGGENEID